MHFRRTRLNLIVIHTMGDNMIKFKAFRQILIIGLLCTSYSHICLAQKATIQEEKRVIKTYPFSEPNPVPVLIKDARLYPYHTFEGYSHQGQPQQWQVVKMENDFIEVYVLPEVGGKVWGAIEKSTGEEFIYRNEVMKFRNIALRGPWTSGGIEFNFGIIGHTPATASPVDYRLLENSDGSVTCVVGAMDLPSRTHWRVQINLPKDKAYFETKALWYNPEPIAQPYYNWMTGAAFARDDLEVFIPGNQYLKHSGETKSWPIDETGRKISEYQNNTFGGHKSYHVVGEYADFFGGYYHKSKFGFGHWAPYMDMPGQKLWLWALSRAGGIWEDLLTDTDGQYIEFQAGRLLVQYSPQNFNNPIKEADFEPYRTDQWRELWFPLKGIGGLNAASQHGAMFVQRQKEEIKIGINAFEKSSSALEVIVEGQNIFHKQLELKPMEVFTTKVSIGDADDFEVHVPKLNLHYNSNRETSQLKRPFETDRQAWAAIPEADRILARGKEYVEGRQYEQARHQFESILKQYPWHPGALIAMADLYFRSAKYADGLNYITKALQLDAYDPHANYIAGISYRAFNDFVNAKESLGWAARSMLYRSAANTQIAEIGLQEQNFSQSDLYANRALDYDRYNINAYQVLAITNRKIENYQKSEQALTKLLDIDPLHHFARFEQYLLNNSYENKSSFQQLIKNEFPDQTYLELAISYHNRGLDEEAVELLQLSQNRVKNPLIDLWLAYLLHSNQKHDYRKYLDQAINISPAFVFPYRRESVKVLEWVNAEEIEWKWKYYLALNYWAIDRKPEAIQLLQLIGNEPEFAPFYIARAHLYHQYFKTDKAGDLKKALSYDDQNWLTWLYLIRNYQNTNQWESALHYSTKAYQQFRDNFNIAIAQARSLIFSDQSKNAIEILNTTQVLPSEMARDCRILYDWAHLHEALRLIGDNQFSNALKIIENSKKWPENLGQGKPYDPDQRMQDYLHGYCYQKLNDNKKASSCFQQIIDYTNKHETDNTMLHYLGYKSLKQKGKHKEAQAFINKLATGPNAQKPEIKWIIAQSKSNEKLLAQLNAVNPNLFSGQNYLIFSKIILLH